MASRIIVTPFTLEGIDPDLRTALKGLEKVSVNSVERIDDFNAMLFDTRTFNTKSITEPVYSGLTDAVEWDGIEEIPSADTAYLHDVTATQAYYANGITYTFDSLTFDPYGYNSQMSGELTISGESKRQKLGAAALFDFTSTWYDGVAFFASNHPLSPVIGGTQSNLVSGAMSHDTLQDMIDYGCSMVDPMDRPMNATAAELWVDVSRVSEAEYYLNSGNRLMSGTGNNDNNPFGGIKLVAYPYMPTATTYAMRFKTRRGRQCYRSAKIPLKLMPIKETSAHGYKRDLIFCEAYWKREYYEWVGSTGV